MGTQMMFWLIILIAFVWLGTETSWLTIRLPSGALQSPTVACEPVTAIKLLAPVKQPLLLCAPKPEVLISLEHLTIERVDAYFAQRPYYWTDDGTHFRAHLSYRGQKGWHYIGRFLDAKEAKSYYLLSLPKAIEAPSKPVKTDTPYWWQSPEMKTFCLQLCQNDYRCAYRKKCRDTERWCGWKLPAKTIKAWGTTMHLAEGCNIKRALFLKSMAREVKRKPSSPTTTSVPLFITQERTGSEKVQHGTRGGKRYYQYDDTYVTVYHDCLVSKSWLTKHYKDVIPEPTMEVIVNGKTLSVNGNYKKGVIQDFMGKYTERKRVGKKVQNVVKGSTIVDYGGGLKIAELPEDWQVK